jgi:8-oxo-dGTP diphosphatase
MRLHEIFGRYAYNASAMTWTATNSEGYSAPAALATDVVVLSIRSSELHVLLARRPDGQHALPGGFVGAAESPDETARRKLHEKTGVADLYLEQLATFADPRRDPRGWIPSIAFVALVSSELALEDDRAAWLPARRHPPLAFDHDEIVATALERIEGKLWWSNVAVGILPPVFTMTEARTAYEAIAARSYDPATFARDLRATGLVEAAHRKRRQARGRPAELYRFSSRELQWGAGRRKRVSETRAAA